MGLGLKLSHGTNVGIPNAWDVCFLLPVTVMGKILGGNVLSLGNDKWHC